MADEKTDQPIDWEAKATELQDKLDEAKANSRKWEKLAKANKDAATQLDEAHEKAKTADERIADLTKRLDEKEAAEKRAKLVAKVSKEKGVPAEILAGFNGNDEESLGAWADTITAAYKKPAAPSVPNPGTFATDGKKSDLEETRKALFG